MNYLERVDSIVLGLEGELKEMALDIHAHPELAMKEYHACEVQCKLLQKHSFEVERSFCGLETAYKACYKGKKPGPKIAMLAEYDALPNIGHGCGHNLIATVGVGAGIAMKEFADELGGEIYVVGTPAEEAIGGKVIMADCGGFDTFDVAMMSHPGSADMESMNTLALKSVTFDYYGQTAHASAEPYKGVNALDAVINLFNMINALRQQTKDDARIHGVITDGGKTPNVIPDHTQAFFFVRAEKVDYLDELYQKVVHCAEAAALGTGCRLEIKKAGNEYSDTNSNSVLTLLNTKNMELLGKTMLRTGGKAVPGSSDLGNVSYRCPAIQTMFDITGYKAIPGHTVEMAAAAVTEYALNQTMVCIKSHVLTAIDLMKEPKYLEEIRKEFAKISKRPK